MTVVVAGGTGLVGQSLVARLATARPGAVHVIGRRKPDGLPAGVASHVAAPEDWPALVESLAPEAAVCALGTTIRDAGSQAAFRAVDHDLVVNFARAARSGGATHFLLVSSVGANAAASNFYLRTKGEAEAAVGQLGFGRVDVFRPGLLTGPRDRANRLGERIAVALSPVTDFLTPAVLDQYRSVAADQVAGAMAALIGADGEGVFIHHNHEMVDLVRR